MLSVIIDVLCVVGLVVYLIFGFTIMLDCKKIVSKYKNKDLSFKEFVEFMEEK